MTRGDWQRLLHIRTYCEDVPKVLAFCERELDSYNG